MAWPIGVQIPPPGGKPLCMMTLRLAGGAERRSAMAEDGLIVARVRSDFGNSRMLFTSCWCCGPRRDRRGRLPSFGNHPSSRALTAGR